MACVLSASLQLYRQVQTKNARIATLFRGNTDVRKRSFSYDEAVNDEFVSESMTVLKDFVRPFRSGCGIYHPCRNAYSIRKNRTVRRAWPTSPTAGFDSGRVKTQIWHYAILIGRIRAICKAPSGLHDAMVAIL